MMLHELYEHAVTARRWLGNSVHFIVAAEETGVKSSSSAAAVIILIEILQILLFSSWALGSEMCSSWEVNWVEDHLRVDLKGLVF